MLKVGANPMDIKNKM